MDYIIRLGVEHDATTIAKFQVAMARETENKALDPDQVETAVRAVFADPGKGFYVVAESSGEVIASLLITFEWSDWRNSNLWYIQSVFVTESARGQGVFKSLYGDVMERAKEAGVLYLRLYVETENTRAQSAYESLGMKKLPYFMYDAKVS